MCCLFWSYDCTDIIDTETLDQTCTNHQPPLFLSLTLFLLQFCPPFTHSPSSLSLSLSLSISLSISLSLSPSPSLSLCLSLSLSLSPSLSLLSLTTSFTRQDVPNFVNKTEHCITPITYYPPPVSQQKNYSMSNFTVVGTDEAGNTNFMTYTRRLCESCHTQFCQMFTLEICRWDKNAKMETHTQSCIKATAYVQFFNYILWYGFYSRVAYLQCLRQSL